MVAVDFISCYMLMCFIQARSQGVTESQGRGIGDHRLSQIFTRVRNYFCTYFDKCSPYWKVFQTRVI